MRKPKEIPFWKRAKEQIKICKISQKNFAQSIGLNYNTMRFWLSYGYYPDARTTYDMAKALGVSMEYLLTGRNKQVMKNRKREMVLIKSAITDIQKMIRKIEKKMA